MKGVLLLLAGVLGSAAEDLPEPIAHVLDLAREAGPEFYGDAVFRITGGRRVVSPEKEKQLLEEVFDSAQDIRVALPLVVARPAAGAERARVLARVRDLRLERVTLQSRVVDRMIALQEGRRARVLLEKIDLPLPAKPACADLLIPVAPYYWDTLASLVLQNSAFTLLERERKRPLELIEHHVRSILAATDVGPAAQAARRVMLADGDPDGRLVTALGSALASIQDSDRAFSYAVESMGVVENVLALAEEARRRRMPTAGLVFSLRAFLVRHYQAVRCADTIALPDSTPSYLQVGALIRPIQTFNQRAPVYANPLPPILDKDRQPAGIDSSQPQSQPAQLLTYAAITGRIDALPRGRSVPGAYRPAGEEVLKMMLDWHEDSVLNGPEFFHQKSAALRAFLQKELGGDLFHAALAEYVKLLLGTPARRDAPAEWLYEVDSLLALARQPEDRRGSAAHPSSGEIIKTLVDSYDPTLQLYGRLEQMFPLKR